MRIPLRASVVALAMSGALAHLSDNGGTVRRRKTLGFGPEHPHAVFNTSPAQSFVSFDAGSDPITTAVRYATDLLSKNAGRGSSFRVREDSYTDDNTGVTHVYLRQIVNGLEVADGDMNINVKDGRVLSYGDSVIANFLSIMAPLMCSRALFYSSIAGQPLRRCTAQP